VTENDLRTKILSKLHEEGEIIVGHDIGKLSTELASMAIEYFRTIHSKALACHCECLGMNAENAMAVCGNLAPPYDDAAYFRVMQKWGLLNDKGEPQI